MTTQRTAVVLAGSEGLGLASAQCLAEAGHRVVLFSRSKDKLEAAQTRLAQRGHAVQVVAGDLASADDLERLFTKVESHWGGVDILVSNTGGPPPGTILELGDEAWREAFEGQALCIIRAIRRVVPGMCARAWGRIITIASLSVKMPIDGLDLSNFMRGGLAAVHRTLARNLAAHQVNVHMVLPGSIMTARSRERIQKRADTLNIPFEQALAASQQRIPKGRLGAPEDVGHVVAFLASEQASYLAGTCMRVDGGMYPGVD